MLTIGLPQSIDFVISKCSSPGRVRKEIVGHPMSPLVEKSGVVLFRSPSGWHIEVNLIPDWVCPYLPEAARPVRQGNDNKDNVAGSLPYISLEDLIIFKADACGLRESDRSKRQEANDAAALLEVASHHTPLLLDEDRMDRMEEAFEDIIEFSGHEKSWWQRRLGQVPDKQRSPQEIFSDLADEQHQLGSSFSSPTPTPPTSPGSVSGRSSIYSTMSRTSSFTSAAMTHSVSSLSAAMSAQEERPNEKSGRQRKMSFTSKPPRHKRHPSLGKGSHPTLESSMERLEIGRSASPGVGLRNRI